MVIILGNRDDMFLQGLFCKGNVLLEMGQQTEALALFHRCLKVQADFVPAKSQIKKVWWLYINSWHTLHNQVKQHMLHQHCVLCVQYMMWEFAVLLLF